MREFVDMLSLLDYTEGQGQEAVTSWSIDQAVTCGSVCKDDQKARVIAPLDLKPAIDILPLPKGALFEVIDFKIQLHINRATART